MNYWYAARRNEMFLDLDSRRALRRAVSVLLAAVKKKALPGLKAVYFYRTKQRDHFHMIISFYDSDTLGQSTKHAWGLWMGNDRLRVAYVLARTEDYRVPYLGPALGLGGFPSGDLLVTTKEYFRKPDAVCKCKRKHKEDAITRRCPAMRALLGKAHSADYFARTGERRVKPLRVRVPWGLVTIQDLKKWVRR